MTEGPFDGTGARQERFADYYDFSGRDGKEKAMRPVRRFELNAMFAQYHRAQESRAFHRRLWRWLTTRQSWAATALPAPTRRQVMRAEIAAAEGKPA